MRRPEKNIVLVLVIFLTLSALVNGQNSDKNPTLNEAPIEETKKPDIQNNDVKLFIDKIEVEGRLEKPQVMLFLPGQTPEIDDIQIERSFMKKIFRPVEKRITVETKYRTEYTKNQKSVIEW